MTFNKSENESQNKKEPRPKTLQKLLLQYDFLEYHVAMVAKKKAHSKLYLLSEKQVSKWLPQRDSQDHKAKGGKTLILAGSQPMPGAGILAARAAMRIGASFVYLETRDSLQAVPEALLFRNQPLSEFNAILAGPGWGQSPQTFNRFKKLLKSQHPHVVLDADGLNLLGKLDQLTLPSSWILTPHPGEMGRLLKKTTDEIQSNRLASVRAAQKKYGCIIVLKGPKTLISFPNITVVNTTGNVALAKAGTGDVLAGFIVGLLAQGVTPEKAALIGCYLHGKLADLWLEQGKDYLSLTPTDLLIEIPNLLGRIRKKT